MTSPTPTQPTNIPGAVQAVETAVTDLDPALANTRAGQAVLNVTPETLEETRRGPKTTEFWGAIVAAIVDVVTNLDTKDKALVTALAGVYAVARGIAKNGIPNIPTP